MISSLLKPTIVLNEKKYKVMGQIGEGGFAFVYNVMSVNKSDRKENYALKKMICQTEEQLEEAQREIDIMKTIKHENILSLVDHSIVVNKKGQNEVLLLLPLCDSTVQALVDRGPGFPYCCFEDGTDLVKIIRGCIEGLLCIHSFGFRHADFKPANILLRGGDTGQAIITDFGSSTPFPVRVSTRSEALGVQDSAARFTTAPYRAPELFNTPSQCTIGAESDVWSLGCTMYCMMFSRSPFESPTEGFSSLSVISSHYTIPEASNWPEEYIDILRRCLQVEPAARTTLLDLQTRFKCVPCPPMHHSPATISTATSVTSPGKVPSSTVPGNQQTSPPSTASGSGGKLSTEGGKEVIAMEKGNSDANKIPNLGRLSLNATNFADFSSVAFDGPVADGSGGGAGCTGNEDLPVGSGKESGASKGVALSNPAEPAWVMAHFTPISGAAPDAFIDAFDSKDALSGELDGEQDTRMDMKGAKRELDASQTTNHSSSGNGSSSSSSSGSSSKSAQNSNTGSYVVTEGIGASGSQVSFPNSGGNSPMVGGGASTSWGGSEISPSDEAEQQRGEEQEGEEEVEERCNQVTPSALIDVRSGAAAGISMTDSTGMTGIAAGVSMTDSTGMTGIAAGVSMTDSTGMTGIADEGVEDSSFGEFVFAETLGQLCIDCPTGAGGEAGGEVAESHTSSAFPACATAGVGAGVGVGVDADRCSDGVITDGATVGAVDEGAVDSDEEFGDFTSAAEALRRASLTRPTAPSASSASSASSAPSAEKDAGALDTDVFDASCATFTGTDAYFEEGRIAAQQSQPVKSRGAAGGTGTGGGTVCSINDLNSRSKSAADIPGLEAIDLHRVVIAQAQQQVVVKAGNAFMMRMKGFPKKLSKKQVWLVLTPAGLLIRKDDSLGSKVHFMLSMHRPVYLTPSDTLSIGLNGLIVQGSAPLQLDPATGRPLLQSVAQGKQTALRSHAGASSAAGVGLAGGDDWEGWERVDFPDWTLVDRALTGTDNCNSPVSPASPASHRGPDGVGSDGKMPAPVGMHGLHSSNTWETGGGSTTPKTFRSAFSSVRVEISFGSKDMMNDWIDAIEAQRQMMCV